MLPLLSGVDHIVPTRNSGFASLALFARTGGKALKQEPHDLATLRQATANGPLPKPHLWAHARHLP